MPIPVCQNPPDRLVRVLHYSTRGYPVYVWERPKPLRMPRIDDRILDCVVYLYPNVQAARDGESAGGSGFIVGIPFSIDAPEFYWKNFPYSDMDSERWRWLFYAITTAHVIRGQAPIIRVNTQDGNHDIIPIESSAWTCHSNGDDVAACSLEPSTKHDYSYVPIDLFVTQSRISHYGLGPGDDIFMVGRFITQEGRQRNRPLVRFGNVAMMPADDVKTKEGLQQESFLIETRSLSGFSGSPVFIHIPPYSERPTPRYHSPFSTTPTLERQSPLMAPSQVASSEPPQMIEKSYGPWLLGIDWGHMPDFAHVLERDRKTRVDDQGVLSNTGVATVVPAWKILELLWEPVFQHAREERETREGQRPPWYEAIQD